MASGCSLLQNTEKIHLFSKRLKPKIKPTDSTPFLFVLLEHEAATRTQLHAPSLECTHVGLVLPLPHHSWLPLWGPGATASHCILLWRSSVHEAQPPRMPQPPGPVSSLAHASVQWSQGKTRRWSRTIHVAKDATVSRGPLQGHTSPRHGPGCGTGP